MNDRPILVVAGDPGGARAILPALAELEKRFRPFAIAEHGFLPEEAAVSWPRVGVPSDDAGLRDCLASYGGVVFGTSVKDAFPLTVARAAGALGLPTIAVLDNWMSYRRRLEIDGQSMFAPEAYAVMDELAQREAVADGITPDRLHIVGHPALATLEADLRNCRHGHMRRRVLSAAPWGDTTKRLLVFVSEPAEQDQGANEQNPLFRGYTETTVLGLLAKYLQSSSDSIQIGLLPHPREDAAKLQASWEQCRGRLNGGVLKATKGRDAVFAADMLCGMTSLLLLEALILGKPVMSLQPGLRVLHLDFLRKKGLRLFVTDPDDAESAVSDLSKMKPGPVSSELRRHSGAAASLADLIYHIVNRRMKRA
jgi:hypothetical protein